MQKFVLHSLLLGSFLLGASACTDEGEKSWPRTTSSSGASSSTGSEASSSSSSGMAGSGGASTGGMGGMGGTGGASTGGMGGASTGGMGGASTGGMGGAAGSAGMGGAAGSAGMGGTGGGGGAGGGGGLQDPANLVVTIVGPNVKLDWMKSVKPSSLILRKLGSAPTDANDPAATIVYVGTGQTSTEPLRNLLPNTPTDPRTYHYAVYGCDGTCAGTPAVDTLSPTISQCLVGGGYNILWRHASADVCSDNTGLGTAATTSYPNWWKRCDNVCPVNGTVTATARQLNTTGTMEATAMGQSLTAKGIPFGRMLSSEYCRNVTTAQLMNLVPQANIEQKQEITYFVYDEANRCNNSMALAAVEPMSGTNTGIIGHAGFSCPILDSLAWSEAAIFKPNGMGGSTYITRVKWNEWDALP